MISLWFFLTEPHSNTSNDGNWRIVLLYRDCLEGVNIRVSLSFLFISCQHLYHVLQNSGYFIGRFWSCDIEEKNLLFYQEKFEVIVILYRGDCLEDVNITESLPFSKLPVFMSYTKYWIYCKMPCNFVLGFCSSAHWVFKPTILSNQGIAGLRCCFYLIEFIK
jgi:hypothetical protein